MPGIGFKRQNGAQILMFVYIFFPQVCFYCHIGWIMVKLHCCRWLLCFRTSNNRIYETKILNGSGLLRY